MYVRCINKLFNKNTTKTFHIKQYIKLALYVTIPISKAKLQ